MTTTDAWALVAILVPATILAVNLGFIPLFTGTWSRLNSRGHGGGLLFLAVFYLPLLWGAWYLAS